VKDRDHISEPAGERAVGPGAKVPPVHEPPLEQVPPYQVNAWAWDEKGRTAPDGQPTSIATGQQGQFGGSPQNQTFQRVANGHEQPH
jgi:hypothetical protein